MRKYINQTMLLMALCCVTSTATLAQDSTVHVIRDLETWSSATLNYKPIKKLELSLSQHLRLKDNSQTVDVYFTQLTADYKIVKGLSIGLGLRYIRENDDQGKVQGYENHLRWQTDLGYKYNFDRLSLKARLRYQSKDELNVTDDKVSNATRFKLSAGYNIPDWKFDPSASAEFFNGITGNEGLYKIRYTVGTKYRTESAGNFGLFLRTEMQQQGEYPKRTNVIGFKYDYTLKNNK